MSSCADACGGQGLTEIFFESAEPPFDELAPQDFFRRFPEGVYDIEGVTLDGAELESEVRLSYIIPAAAGKHSASPESARRRTATPTRFLPCREP